MSSVANVSKSQYEGYSYRELQRLAKGLRIPANLKKQYLIELIVAHKSKQNFLFKSIVQSAMNEREETSKGKGKKNSSNVTLRPPSKYNQVRLAPKQPYFLLKTDKILQTATSSSSSTTRQTRSKKIISRFPNLQRNSTTLALNRAQLSSQQTSYKRISVEKMSCARTNVIQENVMSLTTAERSCDSSTAAATTTTITTSTIMMTPTMVPPRKNATMLETLLQAPMSSRLEDIAADCMREDSSQHVETVRTVKVVGDAEVKKPTASRDYLNDDPPDSLMEDVSSEVIMDLRVVGSEAKQLQWDPEQMDVDNHNVSSSIEDSYLQGNLNQCYTNFVDYSSSSDHDHQYRSNMADAFGIMDKKSALRTQCSQDSSEVDNLIDSLTSQQPHDACQSLDSSIEIHENPIKSQVGETLDYSMNFDNSYASGVGHQGDGNHGGDFYNDSVVQDSYYSLDKADQMSPRTYSSIFTEYLLTEMGGHDTEYTDGSYPSSQKQQQDPNDLSQNTSFLDAPSQGLEHDSNLHQDLLRGEVIQDNIEQNEYPVLSLGSGEIGESDFDPITSALTLNFPNYGSLGLSPPHVQEVISEEVVNMGQAKETKRQLRKSSRWEKHSDSSQFAVKSTAMLCFLCNWIGKISSLENHIHRIHYRQIIESVRGMVSIEVSVDSLASGLYPTKEQALFQHRDRLYVIKLKFIQPNIFSTYVLAVPSQGANTIMETPAVCFIQVTDPTNGEEANWKGCVENLHLTQPSKSAKEESQYYRSKKYGRRSRNGRCGPKNLEMGLKDYCSSNVLNLNSDDARKLTVDVMVQTYKDVLEIESVAEKHATYL